MANPLIVASAIQTGASLLGGLLNKKPKVPDIRPAVSGQIDIQGRRLRDDLNSIREDLQADDAAAGRGFGSGSISRTDRTFRRGSRAVSDFRARVTDILQDAINRQQQAQFASDLQTFQNRSQSIGGGLSALSFLLSDPSVLAALGGGGGGGGGVPGVPGVIDVPQIGTSTPGQTALSSNSIFGLRSALPK